MTPLIQPIRQFRGIRMATPTQLLIACTPRRVIIYQRTDLSGGDVARVRVAMETLCAERHLRVTSRMAVHHSGAAEPAVLLWSAIEKHGADSVVIPDRKHLSEEDFRITNAMALVVTADTNPSQLWSHGEKVPWK